jgi:hypothetical protein
LASQVSYVSPDLPLGSTGKRGEGDPGLDSSELYFVFQRHCPVSTIRA